MRTKVCISTCTPAFDRQNGGKAAQPGAAPGARGGCWGSGSGTYAVEDVGHLEVAPCVTHVLLQLHTLLTQNTLSLTAGSTDACHTWIAWQSVHTVVASLWNPLLDRWLRVASGYVRVAFELYHKQTKAPPRRNACTVGCASMPSMCLLYLLSERTVTMRAFCPHMCTLLHSSLYTKIAACSRFLAGALETSGNPR